MRCTVGAWLRLTLHVIELPKIPQATAEERADEASLLRWSRFFAAQTDAELEEIAMADPVIAEAHSVLQAVSDDPTAREIARLRANAQVVRRLEEAALRQEGREEGIREGRAEALRRAIEGLCLALGVPLDAAMRAALADRDAEALQALFDALVRDRAWPS